jgi:UDP-glucose 4-epimerase
MNVLLTGGAGYLGSHTAVVLHNLGHDVVLLDNLSNSHPGVVDRLIEITGKSFPLIEADVRNTQQVRQILRNHRIDAVVHFAGLKAVSHSVQDPLGYYSNNVCGTLSLLEAMQAEGVKTLVFSSSATVYGEPESLPFQENHQTLPINPYGRSKLHAETVMQDLVASDSSWRIICLRYFNPVGAHESALIGENPAGVPNNLMPYIARVLSGQMEVLNVFGNDYPTRDGTGVRDYIHVMDLADGHASALAFLQAHQGWFAINLGSGKGLTVLEVVKSFERASQKSIPYRFMPRRDGDIAEYYADASYAFALMGWRAKRSIDCSCSSALRFQQNLAK